MKDCNAASKIVKTQSGELPADVGTTDSAVLPNSKSRWRLLLESTDVVCQEVVEQRPKEGMDAPRSIVFSAKSLKNEDQHSLGLMDEALDDQVIFRACTDSMDSAVGETRSLQCENAC